MKIVLKSRKDVYEATGDYNLETGEVKVYKNSIVSKEIAHSEKFKGSNTIEKLRKGKIEKNKLKEDMTFKSLSTAANFVTGRSTNGLIAWKTEDGKKMKDIIRK